MYLVSEFSDEKLNKGDFSKEFQGKTMSNCIELSFWFRWDQWVFDIREIRELYGRERIRDFDYKNEKERFLNIYSEIQNLVGSDNFSEVLKKAAIQMDLKEALIYVLS